MQIINTLTLITIKLLIKSWSLLGFSYSFDVQERSKLPRERGANL